jgi:hypothetical protein
MALFNIRHAECDDIGEGYFTEAKDAKEALATVDPLFRYYAGDCDTWKGIKPHLRHLKPTSGMRPIDTCPGTEPYMASTDSSPDYFLVYQVKALPSGKKIQLPPKHPESN